MFCFNNTSTSMEEKFKSNQERKMITEIQSCGQISFKSDPIVNPVNCVINHCELYYCLHNKYVFNYIYLIKRLNVK